MKNLSPMFNILFVSAALFCFADSVSAQDQPPPDAPKAQFDRLPPEDRRPNLLRELGLSPDQIHQIRRLNQERKPLMEQAVRRLREANRNLDVAIYADSVNDDDVSARLKEFQIAQAEVAKLRFSSELNVRKILTPDQLVRFRELRRRFAEARQDFRKQRRGGERPRSFRRLNRQMSPAPKN